jgi:hypothetical protein
MYTDQSPLLGPPQATLAQALAFCRARCTRNYSLYDIDQVIIPAYWHLALSVSVDPVLAIAQMCHETGYLTSWWSQRPYRNPAGIGVTGREWATQPKNGAWAFHNGMWVEGVSFDGWVDAAIPAHVGRLLAYVLPQHHTMHGWVISGTPKQSELVKTALYYRDMPAQFRGSSRSVADLGGKWAFPGRQYGAKIAAIAETMRQVAV